MRFVHGVEVNRECIVKLGSVSQKLFVILVGLVVSGKKLKGGKKGLPWPKVKGKPRSRNKNGKIRKKRSDIGKKRPHYRRKTNEKETKA